MSRIPEPYACDICNTMKREANHWFLGHIDYTEGYVSVVPWSSSGAAAGTVVHLCGLTCCQRWLAWALEQLSSQGGS